MRTAVVLFNLGGPDSPDAVAPFLFNLFYDPSIIRLSNPLRWVVAKLISSRRAPTARAIYARIGGKSPILKETQKQAEALQSALQNREDLKIFVAMRYWFPFAEETARAVKAYGAERVILLPLYPQYSTTTTESFARVWRRAAEAEGLNAPTTLLCCYPTERGFIAALAQDTLAGLTRIPDGTPVRVLFSAHGLPQRIAAAGDPYQFQVERTVVEVVARMNVPDLDYVIAYQSRVGPLEWIKPYTDAEIRRAGAEGKALVVVPVAFVSEHSETLVELDIEYGHLAREAGVPAYVRVPTVSTHPEFVAGLARLVALTEPKGAEIVSECGVRLCPVDRRACPLGPAPA